MVSGKGKEESFVPGQRAALRPKIGGR